MSSSLEASDPSARDDAPFGTWAWTPTTDALVLEPPLRAALGVPGGTLTEWLQRVAREQRGALLASWQAVAADGQPREQQFTVDTPAGPRRLLSKARRQAPGGGQAAAVVGILLDVTGTARLAEQAEARAREQDERLRLAQEAGRVGSFEWLIPEEVVCWSPELERLYDVAPGTFGTSVGRWAEHVHPDDAAEVVAHVQGCMARRQDSCEFEFRARLPSGGYRWLSGRVRFTYAADGRPLKMIGVNSDIDARKRSENALRESESWFRHLADALPIMVWAARPDGTLDYVNAPWRRYTGDVSSDEWERVVHPDDVTGLRERWAAALRQRGRYEARCRLRRAQDGAWRWHSVRAVPICDPSGTLIRWLGAFVDDHALRMLVQENQALLASEQRARQAAEDAGRMKDEFLATLGHELRTPLNAIIGWTSLLKRGALSQPDTARAVEVIERNAQLQRHLIDELLDVSRIISGHVRLDLQPVYVEDVVSQAVEAIRPVADAKGLQLEATLESVRQAITGDPARLQQVFANLLGNAVKFTPAEGRVSVRLDRVDNDIRVRVSDTGVGIPSAFLPYVFDRFRQAESPGMRRFGGLGLGLSIVRQIVHMHGGRVEVTSAGEGQGAEFTVMLGVEGEATAPVTTPAAAGRPADGGSSPLRGLSILIIEDDADSREMLSVLLENAGAIPVAAATVTEALRLLGDLEIDVVLSDIGMPERDGFDLIRALRNFPNPRVRSAPALAVTAFVRDEDRERILAAGFDAHVSKPVEPLELFRAVVDVLRRRSADRARAQDLPPSP